MQKKTAISSAIAVLALAALAYTGTSYWMGHQIQSRYQTELDKQIAAIEAIDPSIVTMRSYQQGVFSSEAQLIVVITPPAEVPDEDADADPSAAPPPAPKPISITIENHIQHGPLADGQPASAVIETRLGKVEGPTDAQRALFAKAQAPSIRTVIGLTGAFDGRMTLPAGEFAEGPNRAQWKQLDYDFSGPADGRRIEGSAKWPQVQIETPVGGDEPSVLRLEIDGISGRFSSDMPPEGALPFGAGEGTGTIDRMTYARADEKAPMLEFDDVKLTSRTLVDGNLLGVEQTVNGRGAVVGKPVDAFEYKMSLQRLDGVAIQALQSALAPKKGAAEPAAGAAAPDSEAQSAAVMQALVQMVDAAPTLRTSMKATIGGETGEFNLGLALPAGAPGTAAAPSPAFLMMTLAQRVNGDASARLPKSWVPLFASVTDDPATLEQAVNAVLGNYSTSGLVVSDAGVWRSELKYSAGAATVNGQPFKGLGLGAPSGGRRRQPGGVPR